MPVAGVMMIKHGNAAALWIRTQFYNVQTVCLSAPPSVRMEQLGCHWTDFHEMRDLSIFRKSAEKVRVPLEYDKNKAHFTLRPTYIYGNVLLVY